MQKILRVVIGVIGAALIFEALTFWIDPTKASASLGLAGQGPVGTATVRADIGSFFAVAGVFALAGAIRNRGLFLLAPLALFAFALAGRLLTIAVSGSASAAPDLMGAEAALSVISAFGYLRLGKG